ncbi:MAG TPA: FecR family protein [Gammaproteobacteria bacterium]|nr:FecR family protein [Gammaproteobacteria bacterium]
MKHYQKIAILLLIALYTLFTQPVFAADPPLPTPVARAIWIEGGFLKAVMPNKEERVLQKMSVIYLHDTLVTDKDTHAEIAFSDNTLMTFLPNTTFYIAEYRFNPNAKKSSVGQYVMDLITGGFRTITGIIAGKNPDGYKINTPVATIGVRGTDYMVYVDPKGGLYIGYNNGRPCVRNKKGELCLNEKTRYAMVPSAEQPPVPLAELPAIFSEKIEITPYQLSPFLYPGATNGGGGSNSFCLVPG